jgi:hypothetical protein
LKLSSIDALTDAAEMSRVLECEIERVRTAPFSSVGYSQASLNWVDVVTRTGQERRFVLKRTRLDEDWTARRTDDTHGREAHCLDQACLAPMWDAFACPYLAFAIERGEVALLLHDLTAGLLPDARLPLDHDQEQRLLGALAGMHARFWNADLSSIDWLTRPAQYCDVLGPCVADDSSALGVLSPQLRDGVPRGWESALSRVTDEIRQHLVRPGIDWERLWADLPQTLLHGDVKVANFAILPGGEVAAFDWALIGRGPCTLDVGWYLAVNASRLTTPKDKILDRYRTLLESSLGVRLQDQTWNRLQDVAVIGGARMLLWSKTLALHAGRAGAAEEWQWWIDRLEAIRPPRTPTGV